MRWLMWMWFAPMAFFWSWFVLARGDFGYVFFSREVYDQTFGIYASMLGIAPETIPPLLLKACLADSAIVLGIFAFVRRKRLAAWWRSRGAAAGRAATGRAATGQAATSLSSAP